MPWVNLKTKMASTHMDAYVPALEADVAPRPQLLQGLVELDELGVLHRNSSAGREAPARTIGWGVGMG